MAHTDAFAWYDGNTMIVELGGNGRPLTDELTGLVVADATVTCHGKDAAGASLAGETWPKAVPAVGGGVYRVAIPYAVQLGTGALGTMEITAEKSGARAFWAVPILGAKRVR